MSHQTKTSAELTEEISALIRRIRELEKFEAAYERAHETLIVARNDWKKTFDSVPDVITVHDENFNIIYANPAAKEILGLPLQEGIPLGKCFRYYHGAQTPPSICQTCQVLKTGRPFTVEMFEPYLNKYLEIRAMPRVGSDGRLVGLIHVVRDITERKGMEESLKGQSDRLESANKELESYVYSVTHDLRAPLRAIDGFSRILIRDMNDKLTDEERRKFNVIRDNAHRMSRLIDDLLAFSRSSRQAMSSSVVDMQDMVNQVWQDCRDAAAGRQIEMKIGNLPQALGDRGLIRQVLMNLLSNAIKFTGLRENAVIEIGGSEEEKENIYCIKDNGVGFDMQYSDKLFGVFQRLHGVDEFEGTGVGLAIVQQIIHRHGGRVWAEGKINEGATFSFSLPSKQ